MRKLYVLSTTDLSGCKIYKIGFTKRSVKERLKQLQTGSSSDIKIEYIYEADNYIVSIESRLHKEFDDYRISGEWFELTKEDFLQIPTLCEKYYNMFKLLESNTYVQDKGQFFK